MSMPNNPRSPVDAHVKVGTHLQLGIRGSWSYARKAHPTLRHLSDVYLTVVTCQNEDYGKVKAMAAVGSFLNGNQRVACPFPKSCPGSQFISWCRMDAHALLIDLRGYGIARLSHLPRRTFLLHLSPGGSPRPASPIPAPSILVSHCVTVLHLWLLTIPFPAHSPSPSVSLSCRLDPQQYCSRHHGSELAKRFVSAHCNPLLHLDVVRGESSGALAWPHWRTRQGDQRP